VSSAQTTSRVRFWIIAVIFVLTTINYASRATLSIAGAPLAHELHISAVRMGYLFSAFGWAYVIAQIPGGALLDRFGSKRVYLWSIILWSVFTASQALIGFSALPVVTGLFLARFLLGLAEAPSFPGNARIVANWFPNSERGTASAIFNSAQYFSIVVFGPLMGWLTQGFGWRYVFLAMGGLGLAAAAAFAAIVDTPTRHKHISKAEFDYIERGGALVHLDRPQASAPPKASVRWATLRQLLTNRMLLGIYLGQYCITALTYFYTTWFPIYLVQARGLSIMQAGFASAGPALCGWAGGILGGIVSDLLLKRGTQVANRHRPGDLRRNPVVQLHRLAGPRVDLHVDRLFREGHCLPGLGRAFRRGTAGGDGTVRQHLQYLRQCFGNRDTRHHRLYRGRLGLIRSGIALRIHTFRRGAAQLRRDRWSHQTAGSAACGRVRPGNRLKRN
jgi:D-galactonate transporter